MQEFSNMDDQRRIDEVDELEPMDLGEVSEVTTSGPGEGADDNIVWGTEN